MYRDPPRYIGAGSERDSINRDLECLINSKIYYNTTKVGTICVFFMRLYQGFVEY